MRRRIIKTISFICAVIMMALVLFGCNYIFGNNETNQAFYDYCVYVNKYTGEAYIYAHGRFENLIGADGEPIVVNIDTFTEEE